MLFSHVVAKYSGKSFPTFVSERIFLPLKMTSTTYWPSVASATGRFTQSWSSSGRRIPNWFDDDLVELNCGPGGVISSAADLAHWVEFLLDKSADAGASGIPHPIVDECMRPHAIVPTSRPRNGTGITTYGMGWHQNTYRGHSVCIHGSSFVISTHVCSLCLGRHAWRCYSRGINSCCSLPR
jgi:CubicO group peptidase (beta-lactamase class C family)